MIKHLPDFPSYNIKIYVESITIPIWQDTVKGISVTQASSIENPIVLKKKFLLLQHHV